MGCAVACVAMRSGLSYRDAIALFQKKESAWTRGYYCREVVEALKRAGFLYTYAKYDSKKHAPLTNREGTIVFIGAGKRYPSGHYLLKTAQGWMNPWANFPEMAPPKAAFEQKLIGRVTYLLWETESVTSAS